MAIEVDERVAQFIKSHRVARLATTDASGRPAVVPICYVFIDGTFYSAIDKKPKRVEGTKLQRIRNIRVNPHVALVIDDYSENWSDLIYVVVRGVAEILDPGESASTEHKNAVAALRAKYKQYGSMAIDQSPMIKIVPTQVRFWSASPT
jgi:PPOX class probable F420-dependent enzyme